MNTLILDLETFSETPIQDGTWKYSEKAEVLLFGYAIDEEPAKVWDVTTGSAMPADLRKALDDPKVLIIGHNIGGFDRVILKQVMNLLLPIERVHDTMACAYAHGLPGSLDVLCDIMQAPVSKSKDKDGKKLIQLFCKLRKDGTRATRQTHPLEWDRFISYAKLDIEATRYIYSKMPRWNYQGFELNLWRLDQEINYRGIAIDTDLITAAIKTVNRAQVLLRDRTVELTDGEVSSATRRDAMLKHVLEEYGVELPDMQASTLERRMADPELPAPLKELLGIRIQATTSSTAKYNKILKSVSSDGRLRGTLQWCGAARTGRDAGRILNPQNLPRPTLKNNQIEFGIAALKADCADLLFNNVMEIASNTIRGVIVAPPGKKLLIADLSNIEGRYAAWLADERWKLKAFQDFDTITGTDKDGKPMRKGHDLYKLAYAKSFNVRPEDVTKKQRDSVGKTLELSMQFGGGCGAFVTFALGFNINLEALVKEAWDTIPNNIREEAADFWEYAVKQKRTLDLSRDVFITCDSLKRLWRGAHPGITSLWGIIGDAARDAIESPGKVFNAGKLLSFRRDGNWLRMHQASERSICYPSPRVDSEGKISFMGMDQYTRKWQRISTYGPKIFENGVQGGSRDVFMHGIVNAKKNDYDCVMRVHDEPICEVPDNDNYTVDALCGFMTRDIPWTKGLPLAAGGFSAYRYRKGD